FPKPPEVLAAMTDYATRLGASAGRGAYDEAVETGRLLEACRREINDFIGGESPDHVVFALNCSDALNIALRGLIDPFNPGHVVISEADHNSILRPVHAMAEQWGLTFTAVPCDPETTLVDPADVREAIQRDTKFVALTHASNVTGAVQRVAEIGAICREMAVPFVVDAAQSIGHVSVDVQRDSIDLLAAPGHKALMGPLGTGFLYLRPGMEKLVRPLREGGTGSRSDLPTHPTWMPDRYEPGSHNAIGIAGLLAGVRWLRGKGLDEIQRHEQGLVSTFIGAITGVDGLTLFGPPGVADRIGVFSLRAEGLEPHELSAALESGFGVLSRSGIHCAPWVHRAIGTLDAGGTTRLSFGPFTSKQDVRFAADALAELTSSAELMVV
ncbi:MAG: aminotransferase class V-fold PLP-dependent enzyme, partial [Planctomycetota bacterium]